MGAPPAVDSGRLDSRRGLSGRRLDRDADPGGSARLSGRRGNSTTIPGTTRDDQVVRWEADSRSVLAYRSSEVPAVVDRIDLSTGKREFVRRIMSADPTGVLNVREVLMSADGKAHAYTFRRMLSRLFLVQGAR